MATSIDTLNPRKTRKQIIAASVGNAIEWFDWYVYAMLAVYFSSQFFPATEDAHSLVPLLSTLAIFAVGFFVRPFGAWLIGMFADRVGRKAALSGTIIGMGLGSLLVGIAPTYETAGLLAPAMLLLARLIQGVSAGGEFAAVSSFLVESAPEGRRGFFSSFVYISATTANLAAIGSSALLVNLLSKDEMISWGWRIPFLIGSLGALVGYIIRRSTEETLDHDTQVEVRSSSRKQQLFGFLLKHPKESAIVFGISAAPALIFYVWTSYLPTWASITVGFDPKVGLTSGVIALAWFLVLQPLMGILSDKVGRRPLLLTFGAFFTIATVPLLGWIDTSFGRMLTVQLVGVTAIACWSSISAAVSAELFPKHLRATGMGVPYAFAVAIFGGTGPYVGTWLANAGMAGAFGWYIAALAAVGTVVFFIMPETAHKSLD